MSVNNNSKENQKTPYDVEQYDRLQNCSSQKDMTDWNKWREENKETLVNLKGIEFGCGDYLEGADLREAHLEGAYLNEVNLKGAHLEHAHLEGAELENAIFKKAYLKDAHLEGAKLMYAKLENASLNGAHLERADLTFAHLEGAELKKAHLKDAIFKGVAVDGKTLIWDCKDGEKTDFTGVGLDSARISPILKERLKNNIRRIKWQDYCRAKAEEFQEQKEQKGWKWRRRWRVRLKRWWTILTRSPVWLFWQISNYGSSTTRIVYLFFICAFMFACLYWIWGLIDGQGIIANLFVDCNSPCGSAVYIDPLFLFVRALYFSIVTMTTLGFGDMHALSDSHALIGSYAGHIALMIQVLLGYILLGALITRFAVLFTSSGPSQD